MSRPFRRSNPNLYNTDYIRNKKSKVMYNHMVNIAASHKCSSSDGKIKIDCAGYLLHTNNQETLRSLKYGSALCAPCDISGLITEPLTEPCDISGILGKCKCRIPMTEQMTLTLEHVFTAMGIASTQFTWQHFIYPLLNKYGIGPDYIYLPWNPFEKPGAHNAHRIWWSATSTETVFQLQDASSGKFGSCPFDISGVGVKKNILPALDASGDCSGAICGPTLASIYGAYMNISNTGEEFGDRCGSTYLPQGTFAFDLFTFLSTWLYLWEPLAPELEWLVEGLHGGGIYAARPPTTQDNYLISFAQNTPLRFYRSKYWHTHA